MDSLLLIDGNACTLRVAYAISPRVGTKGRFQSVAHDLVALALRFVRERKPIYVAVLFDPAPLKKEMVSVPELLRVAGISVLSQPGHSVEQWIRRLLLLAAGQGVSVTLVSTRTSFLQFVAKNVVLINPARDNLSFDPAQVELLFGVAPGQIPDFLVLAGNEAEGIPGIKGIGPKRAQELLMRFRSVQGLLDSLEELPASVRTRIKRAAKRIQAGQSQVCVEPLPAFEEGRLSLEEIRPVQPDPAEVTDRLIEARMADLIPDLVPHRHLRSACHQTVLSESDLEILTQTLADAKVFALDTETTGLDFSRSKLVGMSFSVRADEAFYLPLTHRYPGIPDQLPLSRVVERLAPILADPDKLKIGQNLKFDLLILGRSGFPVAGPIFDTMVASYLLYPDRRAHSLEALSMEFLGFKMIPFLELMKASASGQSIQDVEIPTVMEYACEDADVTFQLYRILEPMLKRDASLEKLFDRVEMPLLLVLTQMERRGIRIDRGRAEELLGQVEQMRKELSEEIFALVGERFSLHSPKELRRVIQDRLELVLAHKTRTKLVSLSRASLTSVMDRHPAIGKLIQYQDWIRLGKDRLSNLPERLDPATGRLHLGIHQAGTGTGRLRVSRFFQFGAEGSFDAMLKSLVRVPAGSVLLQANYPDLAGRLVAHWTKAPYLVQQFKQGKSLPVGRDLMSYDEVRGFFQRLLLRAKREGQVRTLFHRVRKLPQLNHPLAAVRQAAEEEAIETILQGSVGDLMKLAIVRVSQVLQEGPFEAELIHLFGEALLLEVPEKELVLVAPKVRGTMEQLVPLSVPLVAQLSYGRTWSELSPYTDPLPVVG